MRRDWLKAVGDNAFVEKEEWKDVRLELTKRVKVAVKEAIVSFSTNDGAELNVNETLKMVAVAEACFSFGLKQGSSYWQFVREGLKHVDVAVAKEVLAKVEKSGAEKTDLGRGRWFLIQALRAKVLAFCVHSLSEHVACCSKYFDSSSLWTCPSEEHGAGTLAALLVALNAVDFATGPLLASLDERSSLTNVLEEVRGGKQESSSWGPFGFMKPKTNKKKKGKKKVAELATPEKQEPAASVDDEEEVPAPPVMRQLVDIMGDRTPPSARPPLHSVSAVALFFDDQEPEAQVIPVVDDMESSGEEEKGPQLQLPLPPPEEKSAPIPAPVVGASEEEVCEDEKDVLRAQSVSPGKSLLLPVLRDISSSPGSWKTAEEDLLSGVLFVPEPALASSLPKPPKARAELLSLFEAEVEAKPRRVIEEADAPAPPGVAAAVSADVDVSVERKEETDPEEVSEFELQLAKLEIERIELEKAGASLDSTLRPHQDHSIAIVEKIVMREPPKEDSSPKQLLVAADAGDLFGLSLTLLNPPSSTKKKKKKPIVVRQLSNVRVEPSVPTVSIRKMPVNLTGVPAVMTLSSQHYVCPDCLEKIESSSSARFCNLFGRWFCSKCHVEDESMLPGRLLRLWDIKRYKVCVFAKEEIQRSSKSVLYDVDAINNVLFKVCEPLMISRNLRRQLMLLSAFVAVCPDAEQLDAGVMVHLLESSSTFSLHDLQLVLSGRLVVVLRDVTLVFLQHVADCRLCAARRVPCISCKALCFDFDVKNVSKCSRCGLTAHRACLKRGQCVTCSVTKRKEVNAKKRT